MSEFLLKLIGKPYLEIQIISGNRFIQRIVIPERGQDIVVSKKFDVAFILPDRSEGILRGKKTVFMFDIKNVVPLTRGSVGGRDAVVIQEAGGKIVTVDTDEFAESLPVVQREEFFPCSVDTTLFKRLVEQKVVNDLLKPVTDLFEALRTPIIIGLIVVALLGTLMLI